MKHDLPSPDAILEDLADKAALQIDRLAPVAFDAALNEMTRYHRFLLNLNASRGPDGAPFSFAAVQGEAWRAPHSEWISQYRRLFERAANRIGDDTDFISTLAHVPLRLLPRRGDADLSKEVIQAIIDLGPILAHRLEAWVTKRTVVEPATGASANPRVGLTGSDAKAYSNVLPGIVGAWESLLQAAPTVYRWRDEQRADPKARWDTLRASWPFLWQHLRDTAYMLAVAVWNEDQDGASLFRDALVGWADRLSHCFTDRAYLLQRRLLFPTIVSLDLSAATEQLKPLLPEYMPPPNADELFSAVLHGAHDDTVLLTAALLLSWSMSEKQVSDIGARTAAQLLRRELEDPDAHHAGPAHSQGFRSLVMDIVRLEIAGDRFEKTAYGVVLDDLVEKLDNMTERRVVPGRIFTPSTIHGRDGLQLALLAILLARLPANGDDNLANAMQEFAKNERALPDGDRSLRDVRHCFDRFTKTLETPPPALQRGLQLLKADADFATAGATLTSILSSTHNAIEQHRTERLRQRPIDDKKIDELRDALEQELTKPPSGIPFFRGFSIATDAPETVAAETYSVRLDGLSKAQFVDPPMEDASSNFTEFFSHQVRDHIGMRVWRLFCARERTPAVVASRIEDEAFWNEVKRLAGDVGPEPLLIVSRQAEGRALRKFLHGRRDASQLPKIERQPRDEKGASYIATVEGVDVYGADFDPGIAWLFSAHILQSVRYALIDGSKHFAKVTFIPGEDLKGPLITEVTQLAVWADWVVYEITCEDPEDDGV